MGNKQTGRQGRVIRRNPTAEERKRIQTAIAEESRPEVVAANKQRGREVLAERKRLQDAVASLKALRESQGVTVAELARRTGMTKDNVTKLENMESAPPTIGTLERYAQALGRTIEIAIVEPRKTSTPDPPEPASP